MGAIRLSAPAQSASAAGKQECSAALYAAQGTDYSCLLAVESVERVHFLPGSPISLHCRDPKVAEVRVAHSTALTGNTVAENIMFTSSSAAARFVCGNSRNAKMVWKDRQGNLLLRDLL